MIKSFVPLALMTLTYAIAQAQFVNIPDVNFRTYLTNAGFGACLSGTQMDTTCPAVVNATKINCSSFNIQNLNGIQYFDNLDTLICNDNNLQTLPTLPSGLTVLHCYNNWITTLPQLPAGLTELYLTNNNLTTLPASLPAGLIYFSCAYNYGLAALPTLPNTLEAFYCDGCAITALPASLPPTLKYLGCSFCPIDELPALPSTLITLDCNSCDLTYLNDLPDSLTGLSADHNSLTTIYGSLPSSLTGLDLSFNQLTALPWLLPDGISYLNVEHNLISVMPPLPDSLTHLWCSYNYLSTLPQIPSGVVTLDCSHNELTSLPALPLFMFTLDVSYNQLTSIPALPSEPPGPNSVSWTCFTFNCSHNNITSLPSLTYYLSSLNCSYNPIDCLPAFPDNCSGVPYCNITATNITCAPNYVLTSNGQIDTLPLCDLFTGPACGVYWNIAGNVHKDLDGNCSLNGSEQSLKNVKLNLYRNGAFEQQTYTGTGGNFSFDTDLDTFHVQVDTVGLPFNVVCPTDDDYLDVISVADSFELNNDFAVTCKAGHDIAVHDMAHTSGMFFPTHQAVVTLHAGDMASYYGTTCNTSGVTGTVTLTFTGPVSYAGNTGSLAPAFAAGNTVVWNINNFATLDFSQAFGVQLTTDTFPPPGSTVCVTATVTANSGTDYKPANNTLTQCFNVVNSFDPNFKEVYPEIATEPGTWLTYTVHFQNTGTAPAENIVVKDTLDSNLDWESFDLLSSSHENLTQVLPGGIVHFNFPHIFLPDSTSNEQQSHGWIQYRIQTNATFNANVQVHNTASIYFDFNSPIVTNDAVVNECLPSTNYQSINLCPGDSIQVGSFWYHQTGSYVYTSQNVNGCDSIVYTEVTVYQIDTALVVSGTTLIAAYGATSYQWMVNCDNPQPIVDAVEYAYTPVFSGSYLVQFSDTSGCVVMSRCEDVIVTNVLSPNQSIFSLSPNPAYTNLTVTHPALKNASFDVVDVLGQRVLEVPLSQTTQTNTSLSLETGFYNVRLIQNGKVLGTLKLAVVAK